MSLCYLKDLPCRILICELKFIIVGLDFVLDFYATGLVKNATCDPYGLHPRKIVCN